MQSQFFCTLLGQKVRSPVGFVAVSSKGTLFHFNTLVCYYTVCISEFSAWPVKDYIFYCTLPLKYWNQHVQCTYWCLKFKKAGSNALSKRHQASEQRHWSGLIWCLRFFRATQDRVVCFRLFQAGCHN